MKPELNRLYICGKCNLPQFSHREMKGYPYMNNGILVNSGIETVHRYAQDFKINKQEVCLLFITKDGDEKKAEKWLKEVKKKVKVTKGHHWGSPEKLDFYYE
jgi:hypothetical protein